MNMKNEDFMSRKIRLFLTLGFSALLLTMCRIYEQSEPVTSTNGLSCQSYTDYRFFEWRGEEYGYYIKEEGAECSYICPDGTVRQPAISAKFSASSPLYSASKEELDLQFCGVAVQPTPTEPPVTVTTSPTPADSPTPEASATPQLSPTPEQPLLSGQTTMCDLGANLINFRMVEPVPDLTDKTLMVEIADLETTCAVNPTNPSLLTCTIPPLVTFPARVVVRLDGALVNDFSYEGIGCDELTTPVPTTTP
jgi:hypothetical protein